MKPLISKNGFYPFLTDTDIYIAQIISFTERQLEHFNRYDGNWICKNPLCKTSRKKGLPLPYYYLANIKIDRPEVPQSDIIATSMKLSRTVVPIIKIFTRDRSTLILTTGYLKIICGNDIGGSPCNTENIFELSVFH